MTTSRKRTPAPAMPHAREGHVDAQEVYGRTAMLRIIAALPPVEAAYAVVRFAIMRSKLLTVMDLLLPPAGPILDVGCGFGLFSAYFAQTQPARQMTGVDFNPKRIAMAQKVAHTLGRTEDQFVAGDARSLEAAGPFAGIYVLDVMHHVPRADQEELLRQLVGKLVPGGVLVLKDITTSPRFGLKFTEYLDRLMVGWDEPLAYRHHSEWGEVLSRMGLSIRMVRVPDVLPYPHVVIAAWKPNRGMEA